ncbi:MAG: membrane protein insertase YidC, partial [Alistipes sp.]|nr:membrane protein insertase YidC [Alistipes sp.]
MDKKTLLGLLIIGVILFGFSWYNGKQQKELMREQTRLDSIAASQLPQPEISTPDSLRADSSVTVAGAEADSARQAQAAEALAQHIGATLYGATQGEERRFTYANDLLKITFSNKGGRVASVELSKYKTYTGEPLELFPDTSSRFNLSFFLRKGYGDAQINTSDYYFTPILPASTDFTADESSKEIIMRLKVDSASWIDYVYTLHSDSYRVDFDIRFHEMQNLLTPTQTDMEIAWQNAGPQNEKGFDNENNYTTIAYNYPGQDGIEELGISKESKSETLNTKIKWVAFKQQFFSSILIAENEFQNGAIGYSTYPATDHYIKMFHTQLSVAYTPQTEQYDFSFYFGPNKFSVLKQYADLHLQKLIPLGGWIIGWVNRWLVIPTFDFLGNYISNYGLIILLLTIFIKILI